MRRARTERTGNESASCRGPGSIESDGRAMEASARIIPGRFSLIYESEDGRLCLFEDAEGHLSAVDARRLV